MFVRSLVRILSVKVDLELQAAYGLVPTLPSLQIKKENNVGLFGRL